MAGTRGGLLSLLIGILCIIGGIVTAISGIVPFMSQFEPIHVMRSPGATEIEVGEAGPVTLWHDHATTFEGTSVDHPERPPADLTFRITGKADGTEISLEPIHSATSIALGARQSIAIGTFELPAAGTYTLAIDNPAHDERIFSVTAGSFLGATTNFFIRFVIGLILGVGGLVLLILGIVFMVRRPRVGPTGAPPAGGAPPPLPR